ncbi:MAG: DUF2079 domain-containing protein [Candidatus Sulfomarinibacteraceae bacterium]
MAAVARVVRGCGFGLAALGGVVSVLIVLNLASFGAVELQRLREPTLAIWVGLLLALLVGKGRSERWAHWTSSIETRLGARHAFVFLATVGGLLIVSSSVTQHLAFNTYSHDLGLYQEAMMRAWASPPLYTEILGKSFLGEHFSPVLFLLAPVYQLLPSPLTLVVLNAVFLWLGVFPLKALADEVGLTAPVANLVCLVYLFFPVVARSAGYPFHHEVLYPVVLIGLYLAFLRDRKLAGILLAAAAISIKEDAGLYLVGIGAFMGLHHGRWRWGAAVAATGAVATTAAVFWIIPHFASDAAGYGFHGRWTPWLDPQTLSVAVRDLMAAVATEDVITVIAATLLIPFRGRWTWTVVAVPLVLNLTSSTANQAQLALYYGLPFCATAAIAAVASMAAAPIGRRRGLKLAAAAVVINVAALTYPSVPACRGEVLAGIDGIDGGATVVASACFDPLLQHVDKRRPATPRPGPDADFVLVKTERFTWPLTRRQAEELVAGLDENPGFDRVLERDGFAFFCRRDESRNQVRSALAKP